MQASFLSIENLSVSMNGQTVLRDISWQWKLGEQWALTGESGSGKTVLAETLAGRHSYQGTINASFSNEGPLSNQITLVEQQHRFRDLYHQRNFYYQQRYQSFDAEATITVRNDLAPYEDDRSPFTKSELIALLKLDGLLNAPLIQLSSGEHKRVQLAKALLTEHRLLILDQPFTGLDTAGRGILQNMLDLLYERGQAILLIVHPRDLLLLHQVRSVALLEDGKLISAGIYDPPKTNEVRAAITARKKIPEPLIKRPDDFQFAVRMEDVNIAYGEKKILQHINWEVERGSRWSVSGANGAGKSTLLSLITADNPQAYANDIYLFDRKRGTGESIWEIKQRMGFVSPELHLYFDRGATCFQTIASGFFDTIGLFRRLSDEQSDLVEAWLDYLNIKRFRDNPLSRMPTGLQRMLLLARALIKHPSLLVFDEPCQGLDPEHMALVTALTDDYCSSHGATLIFVSHYVAELPELVDRFLRLDEGRII